MTQEPTKKRLLIITDSPTLTTGLSRICKEVSLALYKDFDLYVAGWHQQPVRHNFPFFIYPLIKDISAESENQLKHIIADCSPDIVLCIGDIWDFLPASRVFAQCREVNENFKSMLWVTVDGEWTELGWKEIIRQFDSVVSMSKFGMKEYAQLSVRLEEKFLYPGVDANMFKPLNLKLNVQEHKLDINNTFTILNIGQNCDRKNIPATIEAFAEFQKDKKDVFLFLATNPDAPTGHNLWAIIKRNKLTKNVSIVKDVNPIGGIADSRINLLYNMCKINVNSSIGEGLGLPIIEGMSAGCVPVATNYSSMPELIPDKRLLVNVSEFLYGAYGVIRAVISKKDLCEKFNLLYYDWKKYKDESDKSNSIYFTLKEACIKSAKDFDWTKTFEYLKKEIYNTLLKNDKKRNFVKSNIKIDDLKMLMVIPSWQKNCGIAEYTKQLGKYIEDKNVKVTIYPSNNLKDLLQHLNKFNCVYIQHEYSFFQNRNELEEFLDKAREANVKTVILMHTFAPFYPYLNMVIDKASAVIFHNETFKKYAMKQRPDANNIHVVPMGCFSKMIEDNSEVKKSLSIQNRNPIIGSFGFLRDQKGYDELVLSIKEMRNKYPDILCMIIAPPHEFGSKSYDENFFRFIEDEGMQNNVLIIREYLDDDKLLKTLNACGLFVLNYKDNPSMGGNSAACKTLLRLCKPIIAPNSIAFTDMNEGIFKVNGLNKSLIIESIESLLNNEELCTKISNDAQAFLDKSEWSKVAEKHIEICKNA